MIAVNVSPLVVPWAVDPGAHLDVGLGPGRLAELVDGGPGDGDDLRRAALALDGDGRRVDGGDVAAGDRGGTTIEVMLYDPSAFLVWLKRISSPTDRPARVMGWPPLVIFVSPVTVMVRAQPSSVPSARFEPSIDLMVIGPADGTPPFDRPCR